MLHEADVPDAGDQRVRAFHARPIKYTNEARDEMEEGDHRERSRDLEDQGTNAYRSPLAKVSIPPERPRRPIPSMPKSFKSMHSKMQGVRKPSTVQTPDQLPQVFPLKSMTGPRSARGWAIRSATRVISTATDVPSVGEADNFTPPSTRGTSTSSSVPEPEKNSEQTITILNAKIDVQRLALQDNEKRIAELEADSTQVEYKIHDTENDSGQTILDKEFAEFLDFKAKLRNKEFEDLHRRVKALEEDKAQLKDAMKAVVQAPGRVGVKFEGV